MAAVGVFCIPLGVCVSAGVHPPVTDLHHPETGDRPVINNHTHTKEDYTHKCARMLREMQHILEENRL